MRSSSSVAVTAMTRGIGGGIERRAIVGPALPAAATRMMPRSRAVAQAALDPGIARTGKAHIDDAGAARHRPVDRLDDVGSSCHPCWCAGCRTRARPGCARRARCRAAGRARRWRRRSTCRAHASRRRCRWRRRCRGSCPPVRDAAVSTPESMTAISTRLPLASSCASGIRMRASAYCSRALAATRRAADASCSVAIRFGCDRIMTPRPRAHARPQAPGGGR